MDLESQMIRLTYDHEKCFESTENLSEIYINLIIQLILQIFMMILQIFGFIIREHVSRLTCVDCNLSSVYDPKYFDKNTLDRLEQFFVVHLL